MVSLVINSLSRWRRTNYTAECCGNGGQPPSRETRHPARTDSDEPEALAGRADAQAVERRSGIRVGVEYEAEQAQTKDGAGSRLAEERTC